MSTAAPKAPDVLARPLALALKKLEQAGRLKSSGRNLIFTILR